jgi:hypothetical protein
MAVKIKTDMHGYVMLEEMRLSGREPSLSPPSPLSDLEPDVRNRVPTIFSAKCSESGICFPSFTNGKLHSLERI